MSVDRKSKPIPNWQELQELALGPAPLMVSSIKVSSWPCLLTSTAFRCLAKEGVSKYYVQGNH